MQSSRRPKALITTLLISLQCASCVTNPLPNNFTASREADPSCSIGLIMNGNDQLGTAFKLQVGTEVAYITAAHSLPVVRPRELTLTYKCGSTSVRQKITSHEKLPIVDVALFRPAANIAEMPALRIGNSRNGMVSIPNYPDMKTLDPRLSEMAIESPGSVFLTTDGRIFFTATFLRPGASGAPLLDSNGLVRGIVSGRFIEDGKYTGIGYGDSIERLLASLSSRTRVSASDFSSSLQQ